jgi:hypothetical protein
MRKDGKLKEAQDMRVAQHIHAHDETAGWPGTARMITARARRAPAPLRAGQRE